jgi:hypothetical protein
VYYRSVHNYSAYETYVPDAFKYGTRVMDTSLFYTVDENLPVKYMPEIQKQNWTKPLVVVIVCVSLYAFRVYGTVNICVAVMFRETYEIMGFYIFIAFHVSFNFILY